MNSRVPLTPREAQVVELAGPRGYTGREIAEALGISRGTVKIHLGRAFTKLGISSRHEIPGAPPARASRAKACDDLLAAAKAVILRTDDETLVALSDAVAKVEGAARKAAAR